MVSEFEQACYTNQLELAKTLRTNNNIRYTKLFIEVCQRGHVNIAKWLYSLDTDLNISKFNNMAFKVSIQSGNLELVQWLHSLINIDIDDEMLFDALRYVDVFEFLFNISPNCKTINSLFINSCEAGYLNTVQFLMKYMDLNTAIIGLKYACAYNHLAVVKWLLDQPYATCITYDTFSYTDADNEETKFINNVIAFDPEIKKYLKLN